MENKDGYKTPLAFEDFPQTLFYAESGIHTALANRIATTLGLAVVTEDDMANNVCMANSREVSPEYRQTCTPSEVQDYIHSLLLASPFRDKHKEFFQTQFSQLPIPRDPVEFWALVKLGRRVRDARKCTAFHLDKPTTEFPIKGDSIISGCHYREGKVFINKAQYFHYVPKSLWDLRIGGNQPVQNWLENRKGRKLEWEDIQEYKELIGVLTETEMIIAEIDKIIRVNAESKTGEP